MSILGLEPPLELACEAAEEAAAVPMLSKLPRLLRMLEIEQENQKFLHN